MAQEAQQGMISSMRPWTINTPVGEGHVDQMAVECRPHSKHSAVSHGPAMALCQAANSMHRNPAECYIC